MADDQGNENTFENTVDRWLMIRVMMNTLENTLDKWLMIRVMRIHQKILQISG